MDTYQGTCKYCGNIKPIMAESQEAADERVGNECTCGGAKLEEVKARLMANINFISRKKRKESLISVGRRAGETAKADSC